jgi:ATP-dependent protease HslVU (ClpYQ) peptidase subunit
MTCIAACVGRRGRVYMAADSIATEKHATNAYSATPKAWRWGNGVIGMAGSWAAIAKAQALDGPVTAKRAIEAWHEAIGDGETYDGQALLGWGGAIYFLGPCGETIRYAERVGAIGSGGLVAIGVLASSQLGPEARVREAVRVASRYVSTVGGAIVTVASD